MRYDHPYSTDLNIPPREGAGSPACTLASLPADLQINILSLLPASTILQCRAVCRSLCQSTQELSLWVSMAKARLDQGPLAALPSIDPSGTTTAELLRRDLERTLVSDERLSKRWDTLGSEPSRSMNTRAHVDRITAMKIVVASPSWSQGQLKQRRWLVTGSVDGFVKVFDLSDLPKSEAVGVPISDKRDHNSTLPSRRRRHPLLLAEIDTGGDVSSIDAELNEDSSQLRIATGSYYSSSASSVYTVALGSGQTFLNLRGSLDPSTWCGTQSVSIRGDVVVVGTYTGLIHLYNWRNGWRGGIERDERSSTASIKLFKDYIISVTRVGLIEIFSLPTTTHTQGEEFAESSTLDRLPSPALLSLTNTLPPFSPTSAPSKPKLIKRKAVLIAKHAISEGNKPLLSVSFGESERNRMRGSQRKAEWEQILIERLQQIAGDVEPYRSEEQNQTSPLSFFVLDLDGLTHYVLDPISIHLSGSTSDTLPKDPESQLSSSFPFLWPPRAQSRQEIEGERPTAAASGATGSRAVCLSSLGGVPPIFAVRGYSTSRPISGSQHLQQSADDMDREVDTESSKTADRDSSSSDFATSPNLLLPLKPTPSVALNTPRRLDLAFRFKTLAEHGSLGAPSNFSMASQTSNSGSSSKSLSTSATSVTSFDSLYPPSRADIFTEQAFDDTGLICLGTARGHLYIADYSS